MVVKKNCLELVGNVADEGGCINSIIIEIRLLRKTSIMGET